jgi:hypothetical protein
MTISLATGHLQINPLPTSFFSTAIIVFKVLVPILALLVLGVMLLLVLLAVCGHWCHVFNFSGEFCSGWEMDESVLCLKVEVMFTTLRREGIKYLVVHGSQLKICRIVDQLFLFRSYEKLKPTKMLCPECV